MFGRVVDVRSSQGVAGFEVRLRLGEGHEQVALCDQEGRFSFVPEIDSEEGTLCLGDTDWRLTHGEELFSAELTPLQLAGRQEHVLEVAERLSAPVHGIAVSSSDGEPLPYLRFEIRSWSIAERSPRDGRGRHRRGGPVRDDRGGSRRRAVDLGCLRRGALRCERASAPGPRSVEARVLVHPPDRGGPGRVGSGLSRRAAGPCHRSRRSQAHLQQPRPGAGGGDVDTAAASPRSQVPGAERAPGRRGRSRPRVRLARGRVGRPGTAHGGAASVRSRRDRRPRPEHRCAQTAGGGTTRPGGVP